MPDARSRWVVRDKKGRIYGPFTTDKVLTYIERGYFAGGEELARYPGGDWYPISREPTFYDKLLEALSQNPDHREPPPDDAASDAAEPSRTSDPLPEDVPTSAPPTRSRVVREKVETQAEVPVETIPKKRIPPLLLRKASAVAKPPKLNWKALRQLEWRALPKFWIGVGGALLLILLFLLLTPSPPTSAERVRLISPRKGQAALSDSAAQGLLKGALRSFQRDTYEGYLDAENKLVQLVEGAPRNLDALAFLCLTYRELWPFSFQDASDTSTLNTVAQSATALDPLTFKGATCRVSQLIVSGRMSEATGVTDSILEAYPGAEIFYEFKAELLAQRLDFVTAQAYVQKAQKLAPGWIKPYVTEARIIEETDQPGNADPILRKVLSLVPEHPRAQLTLGRLQYKYFRNNDSALGFLLAAVSGKSRLSPPEESTAHALLAKVFMQRGENQKALGSAKRCYSLASSNLECRQLIVQLGGYDQLKNTRVQDREALFLGDEYARNGDCFAAQAEYKAAFDADKKNALAAFKAGRCLWQLSYSSEAMEWMQKAIKADTNLTEAYVALADYSAQRFNYEFAFRTLTQIQRLRPKDYRVYHGYAVVEYRRKNYKVSLKYDEKAIELYNADVDIYVQMAKNYLALGEFPDAHRVASRAIELDLNNVEAQCVYAKVLTGMKGSAAGLDWIRRLANDYSSVLEYHVTLAEILVQEEKWEEARDLLERLTKVGERKDVLLLLGTVYQRLQNGPGARQAYLSAATLDATDAEALFRLGLVYLAAGQNGDALRQFNRVLEINARYPQGHVYLGRTYLAIGQVDRALQEATLEKRQNPYLAEAYMLAAEALEKNGQFADCAGEYQKAVKLRPESSQLYVRMAKCYRQSGSLDIALSMLKLAAKFESGNADIYKEQGALYELKGEQEAAAAAYEKYLNLAPTASDRAEIAAKIGH